MQGQFKILCDKSSGAVYRRWNVFDYRTTNGITEIKAAGNAFDYWKKGTIPEGAVIIK
jgi:hypothetical protein